MAMATRYELLPFPRQLVHYAAASLVFMLLGPTLFYYGSHFTSCRLRSEASRRNDDCAWTWACDKPDS